MSRSLAGDVSELQARLSLQWVDARLLLSALTHRSWVNEVDRPDVPDGERLEFLGDALLDFVAAELVYAELPDSDEGQLTRLRAALVCEPTLARFAREIDLGDFLRLGKGEDAGGGRDRPTILADAFESLLGAIYLDRGLGEARRFVLGFLRAELARVLARRRVKDAKSRFQELSQRRWQITPRYVTVEIHGPDHARDFRIEVRVGDRTFGSGRGPSKALAAQAAARQALIQARADGDPGGVDPIGGDAPGVDASRLDPTGGEDAVDEGRSPDPGRPIEASEAGSDPADRRDASNLPER